MGKTWDLFFQLKDFQTCGCFFGTSPPEESPNPVRLVSLRSEPLRGFHGGTTAGDLPFFKKKVHQIEEKKEQASRHIVFWRRLCDYLATPTPKPSTQMRLYQQTQKNWFILLPSRTNLHAQQYHEPLEIAEEFLRTAVFQSLHASASMIRFTPQALRRGCWVFMSRV